MKKNINVRAAVRATVKFVTGLCVGLGVIVVVIGVTSLVGCSPENYYEYADKFDEVTAIR